MRKIALTCCLLFLMPVFGVRAFGQDTANAPETAKPQATAAHYFHLEFVVEELGADRKPVNSRSYSTSVSTDAHQQYGSIRAGARVPFAVASYSNEANKALVNTQYQYEDVGVNIDAHNAREIGRQLSIELTASISSLAHSTDGAIHEPVIRQNQWKATVFIPVGKPTVVFTSDDLDSKGSMQVVLTATPLE